MLTYARWIPSISCSRIDIIPAQPPRHVSTIQGNFLSPTVQEMVKQFIFESHQQKAPEQPEILSEDEDVVSERPSYIDMERHTLQEEESEIEKKVGHKDRLVDVSNPMSPRMSYDLTVTLYRWY